MTQTKAASLCLRTDSASATVSRPKVTRKVAARRHPAACGASLLDQALRREQHGLVRLHHALGLPGAARGVDQRGEIERSQGKAVRVVDHRKKTV